MGSHENINNLGLKPEEQIGSAEIAGERSAEKSWAEEMAEVGEFDREKAEEAAEMDRRSPEELERKTTDMYEVEILALNKFAESADFLDEPIEEPTETDLVRKWQKGMVLHMHAEEVQDWLRSKRLSAVDEEYRKELLKYGDVRKERRLFYRPDDEVAEAWKNDKKIYVNAARKERIQRFSQEQDRSEHALESALAEYEPSRDGQMSERGELVRKWLKDAMESDPTKADLIIDWLKSDDGDDLEKRYRALTRVRLSDKFARLRVAWDKESLEKTSVDCMRIPIYVRSSDRQVFVDKLKSGEASQEFAELSDEEKEKRWKEAIEAERQRVLDEEDKRIQRAGARRSEGETGIADQSPKSSSESTDSETSEGYQGWKEPTSLPDQGPDLTDPISLTSPFSLFNDPNM